MDPDILLLVGMVLFSAIFSCSETAFLSVSQSKVDELVSEKRRNAKLLKSMKENPNKTLITVLIANNLINIAASAYATVIFSEMFGSSGVGVATGVMTFLILVFGEITPKAFAHEHSAAISLALVRPLYLLQLILFPVVWFFEKMVQWITALAGGKKGYTVTEGELMAMLNIGANEGAIEKQEKELIENILEFNDIEVDEVMTPRVEIDALDCEMTLNEAVDFALAHSHSRLPIYEGNLDKIVGMISIKDLLKAYHLSSTTKKIKNLNFAVPMEVPMSKKINKLFREFQKKHVHIAIVIDEYGGTAGLVTLEDLLEEIVGEIQDEHDFSEVPMEVVDYDNIIVYGDTELEVVNDFFQVDFWEEEHDTVNSAITDHLHRFPRVGEVVDFPHGTVKILKMKKNVVTKVQITRKRS
ncbi:HlyC/CorC family transporter [Candidatus Gracilibacteria bacterium]|nr:HlyC/CorC family transporter [Candidatus Gracilibacteria bacterium]